MSHKDPADRTISLHLQQTELSHTKIVLSATDRNIPHKDPCLHQKFLTQGSFCLQQKGFTQRSLCNRQNYLTQGSICNRHNYLTQGPFCLQQTELSHARIPLLAADTTSHKDSSVAKEMFHTRIPLQQNCLTQGPPCLQQTEIFHTRILVCIRQKYLAQGSFCLQQNPLTQGSFFL